MILHKLCNYYDILDRDKTEIPRLGYSTAKVSFALNISPYGELLDIVDLRTGENKPRPRNLVVPLQASRSGKNPPPNFACDKVKYIFGVEQVDRKTFQKKFKPPEDSKPADYMILEESDKTVTIVSQSSRDYFQAFKELQHSILDGVDDPAVQGCLAFLDNWKPETCLENPKFLEFKDELLSDPVCIFDCDTKYLHENPNVKAAWESYYKGDAADKVVSQCLITGKMEPVARLHQKVKGVTGAQASGAPLVSFNEDVFCSYGKSQSFNSPVSETAVFKYTTALEYLLKSESNRVRVGDSTVVFWGESDEKSGEVLIGSLLNSWETEKAEEGEDHSKTARISNILTRMKLGKTLDEKVIGAHPETPFYILGLSPNIGRISIRFWHADHLGHFVETISHHHMDMEIIRDKYDSYYPKYVSVSRLLKETVPKSSKTEGKPDDKKTALLGGLLMNSILNNTIYPVPMYIAIMSRIKVEGTRSLNCGRAGFIKAYMLRLSRAGLYNIKEDAITVSLNEDSPSVPYRLGRLFAVLVKLQNDVNQEMNTTINDRYFSSAAATPANIFPIIMRLAQHHLSSLENGWDIRYKKLIQEILWGVDKFPEYLTLEDQGMFMIGYYHQFKDLFTPKETDAAAVKDVKRR